MKAVSHGVLELKRAKQLIRRGYRRDGGLKKRGGKDEVFVLVLDKPFNADDLAAILGALLIPHHDYDHRKSEPPVTARYRVY
jgi:hypothetical protein